MDNKTVTMAHGAGGRQTSELIDQLSGLMDYNTGIHVIQTKDHIWKIGLYDTDLISV